MTWRRPSSSSEHVSVSRSTPTRRPGWWRTSEEAARTVAIGPGHADPADIVRAVAVDRFAFAMEVTRDARGLRLDRVEPG